MDQATGPAASQNDFTGRQFAVGFVTVFLTLLAAVGISLFLDHTSRPEIESIRNNSAVGDRNFLVPEEKISHRHIAVTYHGKDLYFAYLTPLRLEDTEMRAAGIDDSGRYTIYRPTKESLQYAHDGQNLYYVITQPGRFYQLQGKPGGLKPPIRSRP